MPFGGVGSFGPPGAGGALGFADPDAGLGYAYVTNTMGTRLSGDPRDVALRDALYSVIRASASRRDDRSRETTPERTFGVDQPHRDARRARRSRGVRNSLRRATIPHEWPITGRRETSSTSRPLRASAQLSSGSPEPTSRIRTNAWISFRRFTWRCGSVSRTSRDASLKTWVYRVAHNTAVSLVNRRNSRTPQFVGLDNIDDSFLEDSRPSPGQRQTLSRLWALIHKLRPQDKQVVSASPAFVHQTSTESAPAWFPLLPGGSRTDRTPLEASRSGETPLRRGA